MVGKTRFLFRAGFINVEIGDVPVFDERRQRHDGRETLVLREALDRQNIRGTKSLLFPNELIDVRYSIQFIGNGQTFTICKIQKTPRLAATSTAVLEDFVLNESPPIWVFVNNEQVGNQRRLCFFTEFELDLNGPIGSAASYFTKSSASSHFH